ncbi:MAG: hypothetical protein KDK56_00100 [Simkania sp.]|nr:hypothetical protein [Simkania sp.]MCP5490498.1 hypothetical protein [Chlamydiales bacterium]
MGETLTRPSFDLSDLRVSPDEAVKIYDAKTIGLPREGVRPVKKDVYTDYLPPKPEPKITSLFSGPPTLPPPESPGVTGKKRKREEAETKQQVIFKPIAHFGMPFNTSSGSEIGLTPHPQLVMANAVEDCTRTMAVGRELTASTILKVDHVKQNEISEEFDEKLAESIRIARENQKLNYLKNALKFLGITIGIGGGLMVALGSSATGNFWGSVYGMEMILGGALELGSFCLDQVGYKDSMWSSMMAIGGALLTFHGGLMGNSFLFDKLPKNLGTITSTSLSLMRGYGVMKGISNQAELFELSGELTTLTKERKSVSDDIKKHYGALNVSDFKHLFKTAEEFVEQTNQAVKRVIQGTLKG